MSSVVDKWINLCAQLSRVVAQSYKAYELPDKNNAVSRAITLDAAKYLLSSTVTKELIKEFPIERLEQSASEDHE